MFDIILFVVKLGLLLTVSVLCLRQGEEETPNSGFFRFAIPILSGMLVGDLSNVLGIENLLFRIAAQLGAIALIGVAFVRVYRHLVVQANAPASSPIPHSET